MRNICLLVLWLSLAAVSAFTQPSATSDLQSQDEQTKPAAHAAGTNTAPPQDRWLFPKGWIYGYGQFDIAPEHNEPDPNLCLATSGQYGGKNSQCTAFARYLMEGNFVLHPFGRTLLQHVKFQYAPTLVFGKNIPQTLYTWSWQWIGMEQWWSVGFDLPKGFDVRMTQHFLFTQGGASKGPAYLGPNGPWGRYTTFGVRKTFGTYRDWDGAHPL